MLIAVSVVGSGISSTTEYIKKQTAAPVEASSVVLPDPLASNCYMYVKSIAPWLPQTANIESNSIFPVVGGVIVLYYGEKAHYVYVAEVIEEGVEVKHSNFGKPGFYTDTFSWQYLKDHAAVYVRKD